MVEFTDIVAGLSIMFTGSSQERLKSNFYFYIISLFISNCVLFLVFFNACNVDKSGFCDREEINTLITSIYAFHYEIQDLPSNEGSFFFL